MVSRLLVCFRARLRELAAAFDRLAEAARPADTTPLASQDAGTDTACLLHEFRSKSGLVARIDKDLSPIADMLVRPPFSEWNQFRYIGDGLPLVLTTGHKVSVSDNSLTVVLGEQIELDMPSRTDRSKPLLVGGIGEAHLTHVWVDCPRPPPL